MIERPIIWTMVLSVVLVLMSFQTADAFATYPIICRTAGTTSSKAPTGKNRGKVVIFSSPGDESTTASRNTEEFESLQVPSTSSAVSTPTPPKSSTTTEETSYPIDLPSPILLASSMILAIVGTGSGFDLANESPRYGFGITFSIATIGLTLSVGLFYASILKAKAETEADDKEYMKGKY